MNKKGGHVDWVISMGIFIIYVFALFILLRPGIKPVYRPTDLLNNLERNFNDDVTWTVKTIPLFVRLCKSGAEATEIDIDDQNNFWRINAAYINDNPDNAVIIPLVCSGDTTYYNAIINLYLSQSIKPYDSAKFPNLVISCSSEDLLYCDAELGVVEDINGLDQSALDDITISTVEGYKNLKADWGIPEDKEFSIFIDENVDGEIRKIVGAEPYEQANVFVRRIESQIVQSNGDSVPVAVYLRVW